MVELKKLQDEASSPDFWNDYENAQKVTQRMSRLNETIRSFDEAYEKLENVKVALDLLAIEEDSALKVELEQNLRKLQEIIDEIEEKVVLSDKYDSYPAVVTIHPGAGGTESQDWAEMLLRMYLKWMDSKDFKYRIVDYQPAEEAGIKNVTFTVRGKNAYGLLKAEKGIHRLVRISPFDASKRRHTSFASVDVVPLIDDDVEVEINKEDLKIETFRSSGAGGQHVNVTDSAVRITHLPTGIVVSCQDERSQIMNRQIALQILKSKLYELKRREKEKEIEKVRGEKREIGWGNQIRSYILQPYRLVKDHRTDIEVGDVDSVLNGDIDIFIRGYLEKNMIGK